MEADTTYTPRRSLLGRGRQCVDAFGSAWLVVDSTAGWQSVEHTDGGWKFGIRIEGRFAQQVCAVAR